MENIVDASPTKDFFIDMLTRDINLEHAIIDLTDNSIDGALSLCPNEDFTGLWIRIVLNENEFRISDNCGGFSLDTAINYAFKFGRPKEREDVDHSVGRFGVGMKRALFKLGKNFIVESKNLADHFSVEVDVEEWSAVKGNWFFEYTIGGAILKADDADGTEIVVDKLHKSISNQFKIDTYLNYLKKEIEKKHEFNLAKGLRILLNGTSLGSNPVSMLQSDKIKPISKEINLGEVKINLYAGIAKADIESAGWYIYCNDRLVVEADQTKLTGWGEDKTEDEAKMRKFHHSFAMFRGIVLFDSKDPRSLPMNTTKHGIDSNSDIYRAVKVEMKNMMRQILNYLSKIESDDDRDTLMADTESITVREMKSQTLAATFSAPDIAVLVSSNQNINIAYKKDRKMVDKVKAALNVSTVREVGEKTFDYFYQMQIES